jgi:hypothetical protein
MKALILIYPLLLLFPFNGEKKRNDCSDQGLYGKVKSVKMIFYSVSVQKTDTVLNLLDVDISEYDVHGNITQVDAFNADTTQNKDEHHVIDKYSYTYAANGYVLEKIDNTEDSDLRGTHIYRYDSVNNLIVDSNTERIYLYYCKYDIKGNLREYDRYAPVIDTTLVEKDIYTYDDKGNVIEKDSYNSRGLIAKNVYVCDAKGRNIEQETYGKDGVLMSTYSTQYKGDDKNGNWLKLIAIYKGSQVQMIKREIQYYE